MYYFAIASRCFIGVVFLVSFLGKGINSGSRRAFIESLRETRLIPDRLLSMSAFVILVAEMTIVVLMAVPNATVNVIGFAIAAALLTVFAIGIVQVLRSRRQASCRCFGGSSAPLRVRHVLRNVLLVVVCLAGALVMETTEAGTASEVAGICIALFGGGVFGALTTKFDEIVELFG
ncbi:MauE/DoxX family redox-associated membrane protein [Sphaerimonospora sp. CA-214678]|uniref:MauE/DoxX family redox-associated membrane protein n=1 Tax=Sphaerimonospora sp. CA-214678 TaxID=3240029 RepID=UPI003D8B9915